MKKNLVKVLVGAMVLLTSTVGVKADVLRQNGVDIKETATMNITKMYKDEDIDGVKLNKGDWYIELTDGSWGIYKNGAYEFQPVMLGDISYKCKDKDEFQRVVNTYISMNTYGWF